MRTYLLALVVLSLAITACSARSGEEPASLTGIWKLTSYGPADARTAAVPDASAAITFNQDGSVTGNSGCNGFGGKYSVEGDKVTFSEVVSTLMACDNPRMEQEKAVLQVLSGTATYKTEGNTLALTNGDMVLSLTR